MSDIQLIWDLDTYEGDISLEASDFANDETLRTAVFMSIFTWRRANRDDDVPDGDLKGWWGDAFAETENDKIGSRLWLVLREKITQSTLLKIKEIVQESLQWLIDDRIASTILVDVTRDTTHSIHTVDVGVTIIRNNGAEVNLRFADLWKTVKV